MMDFFRKRRVYLDYASATPLMKEALDAMNGAEKHFANPGSIHKEGVEAKRLLEGARESIAAELGCKARQVIFTSGLTESNNLGVLGLARKLQIRGVPLSETHWITSSIEHSSVLEAFGEVERLGGKVTFVEPDTRGIVLPEPLARALRPDTVLVSIGWANNEIGTIQPLSALARTIREYERAEKSSVVFHSDAGQGPLYRSPQVHSLGVDMFALGSGKLYGPRTIGALYVRDPDTLAPIIFGGGQEKGLRSGTEKVVPAVGFAKALEIVTQERARESKRLGSMRDDLAREIVAHVPTAILNGDLKHALPHMLNISIPGEKTGEYLALALDHHGLAISTKSACREGEADSHVVAALAGEPWRARATLRFSLGRETTQGDLTRALVIIKEVLRH